jgi:hypothetical protein
MSCALTLVAQNTTGTEGVVPRLINFSGKVVDVQGKPLPGVAGATFAIYKDQEGGAPLWMETKMFKPTRPVATRSNWGQASPPACRWSCLPRAKLVG